MQDDFDLEKSNSAFDKDALMAEIEAERAKLRQERGMLNSIELYVQFADWLRRRRCG